MGKTLKKLLLALVTVVAIFALAACGPNEGTDTRTAVEVVYAQATDLGYDGTLDEFLALVAGEDGKDGKDGKDGVNGKSAYELAKENGYTGTEAQWVESLKGADGLNGQTPRIGSNGNWYIGDTDTGVKAAGAKGDKGDPGKDGVNGTDGKDGADGAQGEKGDKGDPGKDGINGTDGKDGADGAQGEKGDKGDPGKDGINGTDGKDGADGAQGEKGEQGETGAAGVGIASIEQKFDQWGIMLTIVYHMTDGSVIQLDPVDLGSKWYMTYEAADSAELTFLLSKHAMSIKLTADIELSETLTLDQTVNINLNGFKLSYAHEKDLQMLIADDNAMISIANGNIDRTGYANGNAIAARNGAMLELNNVSVTSVGFGVVATSGAEVNIENSEITAVWHAIGTNNQQGGANIHVSQSKIISTGDAAVFLSSATRANFDNSTIQGYSAFHIMMGELSLQNCAVRATYESYNPYTAATIKKSGTKETEGAAFVIRTNLYYDEAAQNNELSVYIDGQTNVSAASGVILSVYDCADASGFLAKADPATVTDQFEFARKLAERFETSAVRTWIFDGTALNQVEIVSAGTLEEVNAALAAGKSVSLTSDLEITSPVDFTKNGYFVFYGNNHTINNTSAAEGARGFNLNGEGYALDGVTVKISDVNVVVQNATYTRGISVYQVKNANIILDGCNFDVSYYAINLAMNNENLNLRVLNSDMTAGWAALNCYAVNSNLYFENSKLCGINNKSEGPSNNFSTIVFDGANINEEYGAGKYGSGNTVVAKNCEIASVETNSNRQSHLSLQYGAIDNSISVTGCTFTLNGETSEPTVNITGKENLQNSVKIDGVEQLA